MISLCTNIDMNLACMASDFLTNDNGPVVSSCTKSCDRPGFVTHRRYRVLAGLPELKLE